MADHGSSLRDNGNINVRSNVKKRNHNRIVSNAKDALGHNAYTIQPFDDEAYSFRGVWDLTNLFQFAPYEGGGYCFIAVINAPVFMEKNNYTALLQKAFIRMLENEFKGLDGIEDITTDTMEISDGNRSVSKISKVNQPLMHSISMKYTEKTGTLIAKYLSTYLKLVKDPGTQTRLYTQFDYYKNNGYKGGTHHEVFNMLYMITDATCQRIEKAFLLLNAYPTSAPYSDLFNSERGDIGSREVTINFNAAVDDGPIANKIAKAYVQTLVNINELAEPGMINLNSMNYDWSFHDGYGRRFQIKDISSKNISIVK